MQLTADRAFVVALDPNEAGLRVSPSLGSGVGIWTLVLILVWPLGQVLRRSSLQRR